MPRIFDAYRAVNRWDIAAALSAKAAIISQRADALFGSGSAGLGG
jgi:hypothetical protein